jgi:isopentenyl-diphosphate Delta-isomerase
MKQEPWQLYDEQGRPLKGKGAIKKEVFEKGLLHAASHVWIWRKTVTGAEVLLQKRAASKMTWPNLYDISAAGHIDLGEDPVTAALREAKEEIDLQVSADQLQSIGVHRAHLPAGDQAIENEFQWLYILEIPSETNFALRDAEVAAVEWKPIEDFANEIKDQKNRYVPHSYIYYATVLTAIGKAAQKDS